MFEVALLYPDKQQGAAKRYGMPQDMSKDLNLSVILRVMAKRMRKYLPIVSACFYAR